MGLTCYVDPIGELIRAGRDGEALRFAARHSRAMLPLLTLEELSRLNAMMEGAQMAVDLEAARLGTR